MKTLFRLFALIALVSATAAYAGSVTVGSADGDNCYPFMCNDEGAAMSGTYQEVYNSAAFSGPITINQIGFENSVAPSTIIGGHYELYLSYSSVGMSLTAPSSGLGSNSATTPALFDLDTIPTGGQNYGSTITFTGNPFYYGPTNGDLLLTILVSNMDSVPIGSGNGYMWADYTGTDVVRAFYFVGSSTNSYSAVTGALDTTFTSAVPEPGSFLLLGSGLAGLAGALRRKLVRS